MSSHVEDAKFREVLEGACNKNLEFSTQRQGAILRSNYVVESRRRLMVFLLVREQIGYHYEFSKGVSDLKRWEPRRGINPHYSG